ncbi:MAG: hypothetical protein J0M24_04985 [Verrucomicrobia bacterium]|nr:hypothetical protein [Verrucomicrobiota bacterium]
MPRASLTRKLGWILLPVLALGAIWILLRSVPDPSNVRSRIERLRAAGLPTTPAELEVWYAAPPPAENRALPILEAAAALRGADQNDTNLPWLGRATIPPTGVSLEPRLRTRMEGFVQTNREALKAGRKATERPFSRYPVLLSAGMAIRLPHLGPVQTLTSSLILEAVEAAEKGDSDLASADLVAGIRVADSLAQEPVNLSVVIANSLYRTVADGAERVFCHHQLSESQLQTLQQVWTQALSIPSAKRAMIGNIAFSETLRTLSVRNALVEFDRASDGSAMSAWSTLRLGMHVAAGGLRKDYGVLVEHWDERRLAAQMEYPERLAQEKKLQSDLETRVVTSYLPAIRYHIGSDEDLAATSMAVKRSALTACAVERYRLKNSSRLPERLEELVPEFLPAVPLDPFDGRPLRYEVSGEGYVIYSVGSDLVDDRGRSNQRPRKRGERKTRDVPFTVGPMPDPKPAERVP